MPTADEETEGSSGQQAAAEAQAAQKEAAIARLKSGVPSMPLSEWEQLCYEAGGGADNFKLVSSNNPQTNTLMRRCNLYGKSRGQK